jgi:hypothetical protein
MNFKKYFFEDFVSPFVSRSQHQNATNAGPDIGMTGNMINNTFPSSLKQVKVNLPVKKKKIKKKKAL